MERLVLSDAAWERIASLIIGRPDQKGSTGRDNRSKRPFLTRRSGFSVCRRPVPGQQIVKPAHWMSAGHAFQHVLEIGEGLDLVELGGSDEGADGCPSGAAAVGSGKQVVLATERDRADDALDGIGVEFDA